MRGPSAAAGLQESHQEVWLCQGKCFPIGSLSQQLQHTQLSNCEFQHSRDSKSAGSSQDSVALVLDSIKSTVRFQKTISDAWLKVSKEVDTDEVVKDFDAF